MNIDKMEERLQENGELHVVVEEHDAVLGDSDEEYIGLRTGNTEFCADCQAIEIDDGRKVHYIDFDSVIYYTPANEFPD